MKIIFYLHSPSTYQFDFFKSLLKKNIKVYVIYQQKKIDNFNWKFKKYKWVYFLDDKNSSDKIETLLKKINPKAVIIGGYKMKLDNIIKKNKKFLIFYWLEKVENKFFIINLIRYFLIKKKLKKVDAILAIGNQAKKYYNKFHNKVINLPYSINIKPYDIKKKKYSLNFLFVGQLIQRKGIDKLIDIILKNKIDNINFTICGNGPLQEKIKYIKNIKVQYFSFLNSKDLSKIYSKNSILVLPSVFDGWAVVVIEAMAKGLTIISNNKVGSFKEYIKHGINGREINNNEDSIIKEINFFIKHKDMIKKYGVTNYYKVKKNLSNATLAASEFKKFLNNYC